MSELEKFTPKKQFINPQEISECITEIEKLTGKEITRFQYADTEIEFTSRYGFKREKIKENQ